MIRLLSISSSLVLLISLVCVPQSAYAGKKWSYLPPKSSSDLEAIGGAALVVGGVAAAGYGLYKLCDWLFTKTDEQILKECHNACRHADSCADYVDLVERTIGIPGSNYEQKRLLNAPHEELLYQLSAVTLQNKEGLNVVSHVSTAVRCLQDTHHELEARMNKLAKKHGPGVQFVPIFKQLEQMHGVLELHLLKVGFLFNILQHHVNYLHLFAQEASLLKAYDRELSAIDALQEKNCWVPNDYRRSSLRDEVRIAVMQAAARDSAKYPYTYYLKTLQSAITGLETYLDALSYNYVNRISAAAQLLGKLKAIKEIIITENVYAQELRDAERDRIEQEKLEAQRRQAAALESQAWQMYEQNQQLQRQNQLKEKELRLEKERNAAMREQNAILAAPQYNVYVTV